MPRIAPFIEFAEAIRDLLPEAPFEIQLLDFVLDIDRGFGLICSRSTSFEPICGDVFSKSYEVRETVSRHLYLSSLPLDNFDTFVIFSGAGDGAMNEPVDGVFFTSWLRTHTTVTPQVARHSGYEEEREDQEETDPSHGSEAEIQ